MKLVQSVYAQFTPVVDPLGGKVTNLGNIFAFSITLLLGLGWGFTFVMGALGFIQYIFSKGETKAMDGARNWLTAAAIGAVGLFFLTSLRLVIPALLGSGGLTPGGTLIGNFLSP